MDERVSVEVMNAIAHPLRLGSLVALEERQRTAEELATFLRVPAQSWSSILRSSQRPG